MVYQVGDVFCSSDPESLILGTGIRFFEAFWAHDGKAKYGHSGVLADELLTLEALKKVVMQNFKEVYHGQNIIVARPLDIAISEKRKVIQDLIDEYLGDTYPYWRLLLHMIPPLARYVNFLQKPVCSELTAMYLYKIGARHNEIWGTNPDTLADEWTRWNNFEVVFEGKL